MDFRQILEAVEMNEWMLKVNLKVQFLTFATFHFPPAIPVSRPGMFCSFCPRYLE